MGIKEKHISKYTSKEASRQISKQAYQPTLSDLDLWAQENQELDARQAAVAQESIDFARSAESHQRKLKE